MLTRLFVGQALGICPGSFQVCNFCGFTSLDLCGSFSDHLMKRFHHARRIQEGGHVCRKRRWIFRGPWWPLAGLPRWRLFLARLGCLGPFFTLWAASVIA